MCARVCGRSTQRPCVPSVQSRRERGGGQMGGTMKYSALLNKKSPPRRKQDGSVRQGRASSAGTALNASFNVQDVKLRRGDTSPPAQLTPCCDCARVKGVVSSMIQEDLEASSSCDVIMALRVLIGRFVLFCLERSDGGPLQVHKSCRFWSCLFFFSPVWA